MSNSINWFEIPVRDLERAARFYAVIVLLRHADDPQPLIAEGSWEGRILDAPRGHYGFGYNPVFLDPASGLTAAELLALRDQAPDRGKHRPLTRRAGAVPARMPGAGMDLREIRAYVAGDDPRRLDPAATARTGHPHIRSLHEDRDDTILLLEIGRAHV